MTLVRNSITNNYTNSNYNLAKQYGETTGDTPQELIDEPTPKRASGKPKLKRKFHHGPGAHFDHHPEPTDAAPATLTRFRSKQRS